VESPARPEQLAARWQVPKSHVYALTRAGAIPAVKLGRYYHYRVDAIEQFELGQDVHVGDAPTTA
jgi:excisionase family DNA binding protein